LLRDVAGDQFAIFGLAHFFDVHGDRNAHWRLNHASLPDVRLFFADHNAWTEIVMWAFLVGCLIRTQTDAF
jgi:hypothetical protein